MSTELSVRISVPERWLRVAATEEAQSPSLVGVCTVVVVAVFPCLLESPGFLPKISRTWKVLENEIESPGN